MSNLVGALNLVLGLAYCGYGVVTAIELKRGWRSFGFSHFGAAWIFMAFTCGPHHLAHGLHILAEGRVGGPLDMFAVAVGLPAGVFWLYLRAEAFRGGRGDRFISGNPFWLVALPTVAAVYLTLLVVAGSELLGRGALRLTAQMTPNFFLVGLYMVIGYFLFRTQIRNRQEAGGWSASGISLGIVFPTCALMHAVWIIYGAVGLYAFDIHGFVIDWLAVPAATYFLWVVRGLYVEALKDWNQDMGGRVPALVR